MTLLSKVVNQTVPSGPAVTFTGLWRGVGSGNSVIEAWLRSKAGITDQEELRHAWLRTLYEMGVEVTEDMTFDEGPAGVIRPILLAPSSVNHTFPSGPAVMAMG
jgi:hypothetical protein